MTTNAIIMTLVDDTGNLLLANERERHTLMPTHYVKGARKRG